MVISAYDWISQSLYTLITIVGSLGVIIYLWTRYGKSRRREK